MAVKNGSRFLNSQIDSILPQLTGADELIISDDGSTDQTLAIAQSYDDARIKIVINQGKGIVSNFETALTMCCGDFIFLADQDDIWAPHKLEVMCLHLQKVDLVVCDCQLMAPDNTSHSVSFFKHNRSGKGFIKNMINNSYMGCCMGFSRRVLEQALPFPDSIPMHDHWIGMTAELRFKIEFIHEQLVYHRRHEQNASTSWGQSSNSIWQKLYYRFQIIKGLIIFSYA